MRTPDSGLLGDCLWALLEHTPFYPSVLWKVNGYGIHPVAFYMERGQIHPPHILSTMAGAAVELMLPLGKGQREVRRGSPLEYMPRSECARDASRKNLVPLNIMPAKNVNIDRFNDITCSVATWIELQCSLVSTQAGSYHMHTIPEPQLTRLTLPQAHIQLRLLAPISSSGRRPQWQHNLARPPDSVLEVSIFLLGLVPLHGSFRQPSARPM